MILEIRIGLIYFLNYLFSYNVYVDAIEDDSYNGFVELYVISHLLLYLCIVLYCCFDDHSGHWICLLYRFDRILDNSMFILLFWTEFALCIILLKA